MFRARRYRVLLVFAAVLVLTTLHFARSRDWSQTAVIETPAGDHSSQPAIPNQNPPQPQAPAEDSSKSSPPSVPNSNAPGYPPQNDFKSPVGPGSAKSDKNKELGLPHGSGSGSGSGSTASNDAPLKSPGSGSSDSSNEKKPGSSGNLSPTIIGDSSDEFPEEIDHGGTGRLSVQEHPNGPAAHWVKTPERFPVAPGELIKLPKEASKAMPKLQAKAKDETSEDKQERLQRLSAIKAEFKHAWAGYKQVAMGHDEIKPLTESFDDPFNGWGATLVDSLDTLWIMDLKDEFSEGIDFVKKIDFTTSPREDIPLFETVIRYLGGLLGAYDISGQKYEILLEKAEQLAEVLIGAFDTPNRTPVLYYRWTP
jgi:mannosyl-oligosaccharide alpha-1,2-mannosidase